MNPLARLGAAVLTLLLLPFAVVLFILVVVSKPDTEVHHD